MKMKFPSKFILILFVLLIHIQITYAQDSNQALTNRIGEILEKSKAGSPDKMAKGLISTLAAEGLIQTRNSTITNCVSQILARRMETSIHPEIQTLAYTAYNQIIGATLKEGRQRIFDEEEAKRRKEAIERRQKEDCDLAKADWEYHFNNEVMPALQAYIACITELWRKLGSDPFGLTDQKVARPQGSCYLEHQAFLRSLPNAGIFAENIRYACD